jgi:hypothetical protein
MRALSYGGGINSTALALWLMDRGEDFLMVFADTGAEYPETLEYVDYFEETTGHPIDIVKAEIVEGRDWAEDGLYGYSFFHNMVPYRQFRWCTIKFKIRPLEAYRKRNGVEEIYIGFDAGEPHRIKHHEKDSAIKLYPLVDNGIDRAGCLEIIKAHGLELPRKSGCYICPYQRIRQWNYLFRNHPELWDKAVALEDNAHTSTGKPITFFDNDKSLHDLKKQLAEMDKQALLVDDHLEEWERPCGCYN